MGICKVSNDGSPVPWDESREGIRLKGFNLQCIDFTMRMKVNIGVLVHSHSQQSLSSINTINSLNTIMLNPNLAHEVPLRAPIVEEGE